MVRVILTVLALAAIALAAPAAGPVDTMTGTFDGETRSLQVQIDGDEMAPPVLMLNGAERLKVQFDRLGDDVEYFRYSLEHCTAQWQPSGLIASEFVDGFNEAAVEDYEFSRATTIHYVHYSLTIPNGDMLPLISGNYLLRVYPEDDPERTVAQVRFSVCEGTAPVIGGEATAQTDRGFRGAWQQLSFAVDTERAGVRDAFNDLFVTVSQNGRMDNEAALRHPLRMQGTRAIYEHLPALIFAAGNEYRRFETVNTQFPGMGVDGISYSYPYYHFTLFADEVRAGQQYLYDQTQHGRYKVREYNSDAGETEADYVLVHFALEPGEGVGRDALIFLDGDMVNRRFDENSRMVYNPETGLYERTLLLKQGAYNYQYLTVLPGARCGATGPVEGDKWQTVNEYLIKVYHRRPGERYDRLIGVAPVISNK